jgi:hypothetical protein
MSTLAASAIELARQEPSVIRARHGRAVGMAAQVAILAALLWARPFDGHINATLVLLIEGLLVGTLLVRVALAVRRIRQQDYVNPADSLREIVFQLFPGPIAHVFMGEITIWIGLWKVATRPFRARSDEFAYHGRLDLGMLLVIIVTAPVEILLFELLIPWAPLRWFLLVVAVYSVLWFVGMTCAPKVYPHVAGSRHLILRNGAAIHLPVPYSTIAAIEPFVAPWPDMTGRFPSPLVVREACAWLQFGGQSTLRISLRELRRMGDDPMAGPVTCIIFAVDRPAALIAAVEAHIAPATHPAVSP